MTSKLGKMLHSARVARGLSLRELAKKIGKSPSYLVALERTSPFPGSTDETLRAIAQALELDPDLLFSQLNRSPVELQPTSPIEVALHRVLKAMTPEQQKDLLDQLTRTSTE